MSLTKPAVGPPALVPHGITCGGGPVARFSIPGRPGDCLDQAAATPSVMPTRASTPPMTSAALWRRPELARRARSAPLRGCDPAGELLPIRCGGPPSLPLPGDRFAAEMGRAWERPGTLAAAANAELPTSPRRAPRNGGWYSGRSDAGVSQCDALGCPPEDRSRSGQNVGACDRPAQSRSTSVSHATWDRATHRY